MEIVASEERNGLFYHTIRDLRNGHVVHNVTRKGARKLWSYAIAQHEDHPVDPAKVEWQGAIGMIYAEKRAGKVRYDLALREGRRSAHLLRRDRGWDGWCVGGVLGRRVTNDR